MANRNIVTRSGKAASLSGGDYDQNVNSLAGTAEAQVGTTYEVVYTDQGKAIELNNATMVCTLDAVADIHTAMDSGLSNFTIKLKNINAADATISRSSTDLIDGATSLILPQYESVILQTNAAGTSWNILARGFSDTISVDIVGDVTGNLTGNVTGDVTGDLTGNVTGNVSGNAGTVTTNANLTGPVTSSGNATSIATNAVTATQIAANAVYFSSEMRAVSTTGTWGIGTGGAQVVPRGVYALWASVSTISLQVLVNGAWRNAGALNVGTTTVSNGSSVRVFASTTGTAYYTKLYD